MSDQKKEQMSKIYLTVFIILIALFAVVNISFRTEIQREVSLDVYENDVVVGKTTVQIDGTRVEYLLGDLLKQEDSYVGRFAIDLAERTCSEHTSVQIFWKKRDLNYQIINFWREGDILVNEFEVNHVMLINPAMTEMVIQMKDGRVLSSSDKIYQLYMEYFSYSAANGTTGIVSGIPEF